MKFTIQPIAAAIMLSMTSFSLQADDNDDHPTLLITGSPIQQSIQGDSEQLDEYDNQVVVDAGDLLTRIAGLSAIRAGGHATDPVLRGQSQTRINLLQQGAFLHGAGPNRMDSPGAYTEPFGWDELQIIKGVETLIYGAGGPAGTLNFKRYAPNLDEESVSGKLMAAYSPDFHKLATDLAVGNESGYFRLISQYLDQESYEDGDGNLTRTAFTTTTNTLVSGYAPDNESEWRLTLMANRGSDALFAGTPMDGPTTDMDSAQLLYLGGDQWSNNTTEAQIYWNKAHHVMNNFSLRTQTAPIRMQVDTYSTTRGAKWQKRWQNDEFIWQVGADWQNVTRNAERYMSMMGIPSADNGMLQSRVWPDNELDIKGVVTELEYQSTDNARWKSGLRFDRVEAHFETAPTLDNLALYQMYYADTQQQSNENNISAFSRYYQSIDDTLLWAGISSTTRTADSTERYVGARNSNPMMRWIGNSSIDPERHNQIELGAKWQLADGWHELNIYYDSVDDFILRDRARAQAGILLNDRATIYRNADVTLSGFEWTLNHRFADTWHLHTNLAYVKGERRSSGHPLYQIPPVEGLLQISNQLDRLGYWLDIKWALSQSNVDDNPMTGSALDAGESDGWASINFKIRYELMDAWQISFGVNNLLDETYAYHVSRANLDPFNPGPASVNEPGRQFWVSVLTEL